MDVREGIRRRAEAAGARHEPVKGEPFEGRILMLVPHEPRLDPRIGWVTGLCRTLARTDVLAATWGQSGGPTKEYDGVVSVERFPVVATAAPLARQLLPLFTRLGGHATASGFAERQGRPPRRRGRARFGHHAGGVARWAANWSSYALLVTALYRRGRAVNVAPAVVIAHDIYSLIPAALLRRRWGAAVIYDSHEYASQGDLIAPRWQELLTRRVERFFVRRVDRVITVSPPLARQLERDFGLTDVISVPNAEPRAAVTSPEPTATPTDVVRFLLQGQAAPGRGFERLFELWGTLEDPRARLLVRCPDGEYPAELRRRFVTLFDSGRAEWLEPVPESELVSAASLAEVGVIPYLGPNRNHLYACPNKLSQYMAAGLAILSTDLVYVRELVERFDCGAVYDPDDPDAFRRAVDLLVSNPQGLLERRRRAYAAAREDFNWEIVSTPYVETISALLRSCSRK